MGKLSNEMATLVDMYKKQRENSINQAKSLLKNIASQVPYIMNTYTLEGRQELLRDKSKFIDKNVIEPWNAFNKKLNKLANDRIAIVKNEVIKEPARSSDYQAKIQNAIAFIKPYGSELSDQEAFDVLKDFIDDFEIMKQFENIIYQQVSIGGTRYFDTQSFHKTFGRYHAMKKLVDKFDEIEAEAKDIFVRPRTSKLVLFQLGMDNVAFPDDSYDEMNSHDLIVRYARELEELLSAYKELGNSFVSQKSELMFHNLQ